MDSLQNNETGAANWTIFPEYFTASSEISNSSFTENWNSSVINNGTNETLTDDDNEAVKKSTYFIVTTNAENGILLFYLLLILLWSTVGNLRIFYLIVTRECYHTPYFYIIGAYAITDVIQVLSTAPLMIVGILLNKSYRLIPEWFCTVCGVLSPGMVFISFHTLGLIAIERFYFFVHPLKYPLKFTPRLTGCAIGCIWVVALLFSLIIEMMAPKQFYVTIIHCQTPSARLFTFIQIVLYLMPAFLCTVFSLIKLYMLQSSHQARVEDVPNEAFQRSAKKFKKSRGAAIKIIVLTSGTFWITFLPVGVFRMIVFSHGFTWDYLDSFENAQLSYTFRYLNVFLFTLSSALNPIIYLYTHKPMLRQFFSTARSDIQNEQIN